MPTANDLDSELTFPGYLKLYHCPRADRRGGGTALSHRHGVDVGSSNTKELLPVQPDFLLFSHCVICV